MATPEEVRDLTRLLGAAGRAHHVEFGGPNPEWPEWYATFLIDNGLDSTIGFDPRFDDVVKWLKEADENHRAEAPEERWPGFYAERIFGWIENG
jgi:hypothetical protein